jgi:long-chain fatty acid transport protein
MLRRNALALAASALAAVATGSSTARAGGFAVSDQSAVAGGVGGASTAREGDPSAVWYNPAALADGGGLKLGAGVLLARPSISASAQDGSFESQTDSGFSAPPYLHVAYARDNFVAGIYAGVPFGGGVTWPADWQGRDEIISSELSVLRAAPFVGYRWNRWRVAGGLHVDAARMQIHRGLDFVDSEGDVYLDLDGVGIGADLSLWYQLSDEIQLGASYKSRSNIKLKGDADFESIDAFAMRTQDQHVRSELHLPDRLAVGGVWKRDGWTFLGDLEMTAWSVNDSLEFRFDMEETPDAVQQNDWHSTIGVRLGAERKLRQDLVARAGAYFDPSPAPAEKLAPSSPDANRLGGSLGAGYRIAERFFVDGFYELMWLMPRDSKSDNSVAASYDGYAHLMGLGLRMQQ